MSDQKQEVNYGRMLFSIYHRLETHTAEEVDEAWNNLTPEQRERYETAVSRCIGHWAEGVMISTEKHILTIEQKAEELAFDALEAIREGNGSVASSIRASLMHLRNRMHDAFNYIENLMNGVRKVEPRRREPLNF